MRRSSLLFVTITLVAMLVLSISACNYEPAFSEEGMLDRSEIEIQEGNTAEVGDIKWELIDVENLGTQIEDESGAVLKPTRGKFIFVSFTVENNSDEGRVLYDMKVIDGKGRIYSICTEAYGYFSSTYSACTLADIPPGAEPLKFSASFDINLDSEDLILEVTDLQKPPSEKAYIDLGL